jgi:hypothetical protein
MTKFVLLAAFGLILAVATPAQAQYSDKPVHFNLGGGVAIPVSDVSDRFGTGGSFNIGIIIEPAPAFGLQVEYAYHKLAGEDKTIPTSPIPTPNFTDTALIESHHSMQFINFNGILRTTGNSVISPYAIGGGGMYYRSVSLTTPDVGYTTWCDPYWYVCYPALVEVDRIIGDRGGWDPGINVGGGLTMKLGESALFYVETRWHYMWGPEFTDANGVTQKANGQYFPITFGFRF